MKPYLFYILLVLFVGIVFYDTYVCVRPKKVRFNLQPTYFGVPGKRPPNLPIRWV
jgi:hypothetical protein